LSTAPRAVPERLIFAAGLRDWETFLIDDSIPFALPIAGLSFLLAAATAWAAFGSRRTPLRERGPAEQWPGAPLMRMSASTDMTV